MIFKAGTASARGSRDWGSGRCGERLPEFYREMAMNMSTDELIRIVSTLGFPILVAVAAGMVLFRLGVALTDRHLKSLDKSTEEIQAQTKVLQDIRLELPKICKARCQHEQECQNFSPRESK